LFEKHVHERDAQPANLTATSAILVPEAKAMLLDPEELLINPERFSRPERSRGGQLALSVSQDFSKVAGGGHLGL
jgi:hypothetical protein